MFDCDKCEHQYCTSCANVVRARFNAGCPYCSSSHPKFCEKGGCDECFKRSFASNPNSKFWSDKNKLKPHQVSRNGGKKFWFDCPDCSHSFESMISNIVKGQWCPYCSSKKICGDKGCSHCFKRSFASYPRAENWSDKNELKPHQVALRSHKKFSFDCPECNNTFSSQCNNVVSGCWCPHCVNKTETKLLEWLRKQPIIKKVKHQYKPKWCSTEYRCIIKGARKTRRYQYSYDFLVTLKNGKQIIIELDGPQHFKQVSNWQSPFITQVRDAYKERKARQHKIPVVRILQEDVWYDRGDWESELTTKLI